MAKQNNTLSDQIVLMIGAGMATCLLNWIVFPIIYLIFHDCGHILCFHYFEVTWWSILITFVVVLIFFELLAAMEVSSKPTPRSRRGGNRRGGYGSNYRETDYYDEDMEGAPGFYGED